jgi:NAD(P)-dependent dehydrogenase (short-subunit alcohol dehydrogenase family)
MMGCAEILTMYELGNQVAIVTGAGRRGGIGAAIGMRLAQEGANVVIGDICAPIADLPNPGGGQWEELESLADQIQSLGVRSLPVRVDVTDASLVEAMIAQTAEAFGQVDILVNNAGGIIGPAPVIQTAEDAWRRTLEINATGTFLCSKAALPIMIQGGRGGRIINISSVAAKAPKPYMAAYAASKAAVVALTRSLAQEVAQFGITVNAVLPGDVDTAMKQWGFRMESTFTGKSYDKVVADTIAQIPLGRLETVEDVANLVAFLASDQASFITAQAYTVSGGRVRH